MLKRKTWKTLLSMTLALSMLFAIGGASAFAAEDDQRAYAIAFDGETMEVTASGAKITESDDAAWTYSQDGGKAILTVEGDAEVKAEGGLQEYSYVDENGETATYTSYSSATGASARANGSGSVSSTTVQGDVTASIVDGFAYGASVYASEEAVASVKVGGDVSAENETDSCGVTGVYASASMGSSSSAEIGGDVSATSATFVNGVGAYADNEGSVDVKIGGDVSASGIDATGLSIESVADSSVSLDIGGSVSADAEEFATGIRANGQGGTVDIKIGGDVNASGGDENYAYGVSLYLWGEDGGKITVQIDGDVNVSGGTGAEGVYADANGEKAEISFSANGVNVESRNPGDEEAWIHAYGVLLYASRGGTMKAEIGEGGITASDTAGETTAAQLYIYDGGTASLSVAGDVTGTTSALNLGVYQTESESESAAESTIDVVVEGTISGGKNTIWLYGENLEDAITLTAWKIEPNAEGKIFSTYMRSDEALAELAETDPEEAAYYAARQEEWAATAAEMEKNILYIIKLEQPDNGAATLGGVADSHGFDTAKEGETVTLKASANSGYRVVGAYNNGVALLQDANGDFYLVVPRGGGVSLSLSLEKIAAAVAKKEAGTASVTSADGKEIELTFYDDGAFKMVVDGNEILRGHAKVIDGKLYLVNEHGVECPVEDDGTVKFQMGRSADSVIEFKLDLDLVAQLIELLG